MRRLAATAALCLLAACDADEAAFMPASTGSWLSGGDTTNTLMFGVNAFSRPAENISVENEMKFFTGNSFFNQPWVTAPSSTTTRDGLGPLFNSRSCSGCHFKDGRSAPTSADGEFEGLLMRVSVGVDEYGRPTPHDVYGLQIQPHGIQDVPGEGQFSVHYSTQRGVYADGSSWEIQSPTYAIDVWGYGAPGDLHFSARLAPQMIGLGLLEAVPETRLEELADPEDVDGDGVSGRVNRVWDTERDVWSVGRFGWKAEEPTVASQTAAALLGDIGITSPLRNQQNCSEVQEECRTALHGGEFEINPQLFQRLVVYASLLAPPARREWNAPEVLRGEELFATIGCSNCHTPSHTTAPEAAFPEVESQAIWPYTDLLLHDLGPGLADGRPVHGANGSEWRTPPLWGVGLLQDVNGHQRLLHDGRARNVEEAILWHDGEAAAARDEFTRLSGPERRALIRFVESL